MIFLDEYNNHADNDSCSKTASLSDDSSVDSLNVFEIDDIHAIQLNIPVPKCTKKITKNYFPTSIAIADSIALKKSQRLLRVLFDSGAMKTMIHRRALPASAEPTKLTNTKTMSTLAGNLQTTEVVKLRKIKLPEFDKTKTVDEQKALVFDMPCRCDIILGSDFLFKAGIEIKYSDATVEWFEHAIPMRDPQKFDDDDFAQLIEQLTVQEDDEFFGEDFLDNFLVQKILE